MRFATAIAIIASATSSSAEEAPWDALSAALSSPDILLTPSIDAFVDECTDTYLSDPTMIEMKTNNGPTVYLQDGSNWELIDQPSKLCADTFSCAFKDCLMPASIMDPDLSTGPADWPDFMGLFTDTAGTFEENEAKLAFPARVVIPASVADVVASLQWAYQHKVPVTVKTSGHHYAGASTGRGTLNINTRSLPAYAADGIHGCAAADEEGKDDSYLGHACRLALARGKSAMMRVGGGEVWDAALRSVIAYNDDPANIDKPKYMALTGAAGTVSAAGGWLASGGNGSERGMRLHGLGVDQVLQMEMVLPDGTHVRFGPDEWEEDPSYLYPKTTKVKGYCNENPVAAEDEWDWKECDVVDFNSLWMAARGGGGGTWGIVTSLVYQLHPRPGHHDMVFLPLTDNADGTWATVLGDEAMVRTIDETVEDFKLEFYFNPLALGVAEEDSNACGADWATSPHFSLPPWNLRELQRESTCIGEKAGEAWAGAWQKFLSEGFRGKVRLLAGGFSEDQIDEMSAWAYGADWKERAAAFTDLLNEPDDAIKELSGLGEGDDLALLEWWWTQEDPVKRTLELSNADRVPDAPLPGVVPGQRYIGSTTSIISTKRVLEERDTLVPILAHWNKNGPAWYVVGGAIMNGHDQMTAIPANRREGGLYLAIDPYLREEDVENFDTVLALIFAGLDPSTNSFPGFVGHNHFVRHGPLKSDWTKHCPLSYSLDEMDKECISEQEAVWGTELLAELEKFKAEIDPNKIMTCATGVGYERISGVEGAVPGGDVTADNGTPGESETVEPQSGGYYCAKLSAFFAVGVGIVVLL